MTTNQPEDLTIRVDRVEARLDNLVEIARSLVQNAEIQQRNSEIQQRNIAELVQLQASSFDRMEAMLTRFLRQSGNGRQEP